MLFRKIFFLVVLSVGLFANNALSVDFVKRDHQDIILLFNSIDHLGEGEQNWLGMFEKDKPNGRANAVKWSLLKDLAHGCCPNDGALKTRRLFPLRNLDVGHYELRVFVDNNDDTPFASYEFWIDDVPNMKLNLNKTEFDKNSHDLNINTTYMDDKTWVGIFST